jgi:hypothetical protein
MFSSFKIFLQISHFREKFAYLNVSVVLKLEEGIDVAVEGVPPALCSKTPPGVRDIDTEDLANPQLCGEYAKVFFTCSTYLRGFMFLCLAALLLCLAVNTGYMLGGRYFYAWRLILGICLAGDAFMLGGLESNPLFVICLALNY